MNQTWPPCPQRLTALNVNRYRRGTSAGLRVQTLPSLRCFSLDCYPISSGSVFGSVLPGIRRCLSHNYCELSRAAVRTRVWPPRQCAPVSSVQAAYWMARPATHGSRVKSHSLSVLRKGLPRAANRKTEDGPLARQVRRRLGSGTAFLLDRFGKEPRSTFCTCAHSSVAKIAALQFCLRAGPGGSRTTRKTLSRTSPVWVRATTGGDHPFAGGRHLQ